MGRIIRTISTTGEVVAIAVDATDIAEKAQQIHQTHQVLRQSRVFPHRNQMVVSTAQAQNSMSFLSMNMNGKF
jgi:hypothetical protein